MRIRCNHEVTYRLFYREHQGQLPPTLELQYLYRIWRAVSKNIVVAAYSYSRHVFLQVSSNAEYHFLKLLEQLELLRNIGVKAEVPGKTEDQTRDEFWVYRDQLLTLDYENWWLDHLSYKEFQEPYRFIVLPQDLRSWDDSDPTTHTFRLYYLCDVRVNGIEDVATRQHKHISNHPGYNLRQPQEFFRVFGNFALLMLKMAKHSISFDIEATAPLDTFKILWNVEPDVTINQLTKDTIGPLVDKAISYLESLPVPKIKWEECKEYWPSIAIRDFLDIPEGKDALGGLHRCTNPEAKWYWTCKQHAYQGPTSDAMEALVDFVQGAGGQFNWQLSSLSIDLQSRWQAGQFCKLLEDTKHKVDISVKFSWTVSRRDLENFMRNIAKTTVHDMELEGVTVGIHPEGYTGYRVDVFVNHWSVYPKPFSVTLLNYPRPQEQCSYFNACLGSHRLHWRQRQRVETEQDFLSAIWTFGGAIMSDKRKEALEASQHLKNVLTRTGYQTDCAISRHGGLWLGEYDLEESTLRGLQVYNLSAFESKRKEDVSLTEMRVALVALEHICTLTVDVGYLNVDKDIARWLQASPKLQELNIALKESRVLERAEGICEMWRGRSTPLQLTLFERDNDSKGHIVAQLIVHGHSDSPRESHSTLQGFFTCPPGSQEWEQVTHATIEFLQWKSDHVSMPLEDFATAILDMATEHNPSSLTSLSLDISRLSQEGLTHVQNILQRSALERLHIRCTTFDASLTAFVRQALISVQWSTLQALVLTGTAIDEWVQLLVAIISMETPMGASLCDLQLRHFEVHGSNAEQIHLTHSSALFLHQMVYANPLIELVLRNVYLEDNRDSDLFAGSLHS